MGRRSRRGRVDQSAPPVAVLPDLLHIYDAADWLPPGVVEPDGDSAAEWRAWELAHEQAHQEFLAAGRSWRDMHELPALRLAELPPDEPYIPPANKVTGGDLPGRVVEDQDDEPGHRGGGCRSNAARWHH